MLFLSIVVLVEIMKVMVAVSHGFAVYFSNQDRINRISLRAEFRFDEMRIAR